MTKMKSKKMTKSTFAVIIMAVIMVAMIAFGGTYAYFTATAKGGAESTEFVTGTVKLTSGESTSVLHTSESNILPGYVFVGEKDEEGAITPKTITLTNGSTVDTYAFATFKVTFEGLEEGTDASTLFVKTAEDAETYEPLFAETVTTSQDATTGWMALAGKAGVYYMDLAYDDDADTATVAANFVFSLSFSSYTESDMEEVYTPADEEEGTDESWTTQEKHNIYVRGGSEGAYTYTEYNGGIMGVTITVEISFRAIQQEGFDSVTAAYEHLYPVEANS